MQTDRLVTLVVLVVLVILVILVIKESLGYSGFNTTVVTLF